MLHPFPTTAVILLAGGVGSRMGSSMPKQYLPLRGKPVALWSFEVFCQLPIQELVVVCREEYRPLFLEAAINSTCRLHFAEPGEQRQDSVFNGLQKISKEIELVCVHDAARPLITKKIVENVLLHAHKAGAAAAGMPLKFTIKETAADGTILNTPDRSRFWEVQTPQAVRIELLKKGFAKAKELNAAVTDDLSLVELLQIPAKMVSGSYANLKITTPEDLHIAELLLPQKIVL